MQPKPWRHPMNNPLVSELCSRVAVYVGSRSFCGSWYTTVGGLSVDCSLVWIGLPGPGLVWGPATVVSAVTASRLQSPAEVKVVQA